MFGWELPPHNSGGLGTACLGMARALIKKGVDLTFILPQYQPVSVPFKVLYVPKPISSQTFSAYAHDINYAQFSSLLHQVLAYADYARKLARELQFDIIHAHDWLTIPAGLASKKISGKPLIIHVHATEFDRGGGTSVNPTILAIEKQGFEKADKIITVSHLTKSILVEKYQIPEDKIVVVHNGIDPEDYPPPAATISFLNHAKSVGNKIVLFVGRLTLQKGPDYFLTTAVKILAHYSKALFVIVGSGDMENQIIHQAATMGISDKVFFPGFIRGEQLNQFFHAADIFVLPSVSEPFGLVPLESIINGTPVLVSKQSGVSEILTHALKVDFWDTDEMANQILSVLNYPALPATLQTESSKELQKLSWSAAAEKITNIYSLYANH